MKAPITYIPDFVDGPDAVFVALRDGIEWERRDDAPRCEYYCNDFDQLYTYGRGAGVRTYCPKPYTDEILSIRQKLEELTGSSFEVCFLNRYLNQRDHLGWHADDSPEMCPKRPVVSVSLGVEREIWFKHKDGEEVEKLKLGHGSCCIMAEGMQKDFLHRIPKASFICGERISLTFRGYVSQHDTRD
jgi:alkylated DNA repair dioxygenase AlkB